MSPVLTPPADTNVMPLNFRNQTSPHRQIDGIFPATPDILNTHRRSPRQRRTKWIPKSRSKRSKSPSFLSDRSFHPQAQRPRLQGQMWHSPACSRTIHESNSARVHETQTPRGLVSFPTPDEPDFCLEETWPRFVSRNSETIGSLSDTTLVS